MAIDDEKPLDYASTRTSQKRNSWILAVVSLLYLLFSAVLCFFSLIPFSPLVMPSLGADPVTERGGYLLFELILLITGGTLLYEARERKDILSLVMSALGLLFSGYVIVVTFGAHVLNLR